MTAAYLIALIMLLYLGLVKALRSLAKRINGAGEVRVRVVQQIDWPELHSPIVLPVYRVVQEILTNILWHGNVTEISDTDETSPLGRPDVIMKISPREGKSSFYESSESLYKQLR